MVRANEILSDWFVLFMSRASELMAERDGVANDGVFCVGNAILN